MSNLPLDYLIYETSYGSDIPVEQVFVHTFDRLPSKYNFVKRYSSDIYDYFIKLGFKKECELISENKRFERPFRTIYFINRHRKQAVLLKSIADKNDLCYELICYYVVDEKPFDKQFDETEISKFEVQFKKTGINLIKMEHGHLDTE